MTEASEKVAEFIHEMSGSQGENEDMAPTKGLFWNPHVSSLSKVRPAPADPSGQWPGFEADRHTPQGLAASVTGAASCGTRTDYWAYLTACFLIYNLEDDPRIYLMGY